MPADSALYSKFVPISLAIIGIAMLILVVLAFLLLAGIIPS